MQTSNNYQYSRHMYMILNAIRYDWGYAFIKARFLVHS